MSEVMINTTALKAVNRISPQTLTDILARHYPLHKSRYKYERNDYDTSNIGRYLKATRLYGPCVAAVEEILKASRSDNTTDCNVSITPREQSHRERDLIAYLDELECNTTRNHIGELELLDDESLTIEYELVPIETASYNVNDRALVATNPVTTNNNENDQQKTITKNHGTLLIDEPSVVSVVVIDN